MLLVTLAGHVMVGTGMRIRTTLKVQVFVKHSWMVSPNTVSRARQHQVAVHIGDMSP